MVIGCVLRTCYIKWIKTSWAYRMANVDVSGFAMSVYIQDQTVSLQPAVHNNPNHAVQHNTNAVYKVSFMRINVKQICILTDIDP